MDGSSKGCRANGREQVVGASASASGVERSSGGWWPDWGRDLTLLVLVAGSVFFTNLGGAKLWDRDEPRNAGCALEMLQRQDWVTPMFNDELRGQKPVLLYWLIISAVLVFGESEFAVRFWSAALGVGTVLLTYAWVRHLFFPQLARLAGLVLATTIMFPVAARAATPDSALIFCSTLAITLYVLLTFQRAGVSDWQELRRLPSIAHRLRRPGRWFPGPAGALAIYAAMSLGVLAKGPVAIVLPTAIIGLWILIESSRSAPGALPSRAGEEPLAGSWSLRQWLGRTLRQWGAVFHPWHFLRSVAEMKPWYLVLSTLLISLPWFIWVGIVTEGDFLRLFFFREHLERATTAMEGHDGGWWFYPLVMLIGVFPWTILVVPTAVFLSRLAWAGSSDLQRWPEGLNLALIWLGLQVGLFSLASTKLPSYVTPCYPAVALLLAVALQQLVSGQWNLSSLWLQGGFLTLILTGVAISAGLYYAVSQELGWSPGWLPLLGLIPLVTGLLAWRIWEAHGRRPAGQAATARVLQVGSWAFVLVGFAFVTDFVSRHRTTDELWEIVQQRQTADTRLAGFRDLESTWVYYAGQPIWELAHGPASQAVEDPLKRRRWWDEKPRPSVGQLLQHYPNSFIVVGDEDLQELLGQLPPGYGPLAQRPDFLTRDQLILVGRLTPQDLAQEDPAAKIR